jgi:hypothetical protein
VGRRQELASNKLVADSGLLNLQRQTARRGDTEMRRIGAEALIFEK